MKRKTTSASEHLGAAETPQPDKLPDHPKPNIAAGFPIVGIGASAGGLAAFEAFFAGLPAATDPGMAFVLVQHLAPDHKSILAELIRRYTRMKVFEVEDGMVVQPNCVYIIPPGLRVVLSDITARKQSEEDLRQRVEELMQFNAAAVGRELRMIELKQQVNELARQLGQPPPYGLEELTEAVPGSPQEPGHGITEPKSPR